MIVMRQLVQDNGAEGSCLLAQGCERSVITYSSLISACEKAGEWQLALQLFDKMALERIRPNVITFNSLITACAQGMSAVPLDRAGPACGFTGPKLQCQGLAWFKRQSICR